MRHDTHRILLITSALAAFAVAWLSTQAHAQCERQRVQAPVPHANDFFGGLVATSGEFAAVGLFHDSTNGEDSGAALIYEKDSATGVWSFSQKIIPADNHAGDLFGLNVAIFGDLLAVGATDDDDVGQNAGSVYIYRMDPRLSRWVFETELHASDASANGGFGYALSLANNLLVVGATRFPSGGADQAYIFRRVAQGVWQEEAILSGSTELGAYGRVVGTDGVTVMLRPNSVAGFPQYLKRQRIDVFEQSLSNSRWQRVQDIPNPGVQSAAFGTSLDLNDGQAIIAAIWADPFAQFWESAYVFRRDMQSDTWLLEARVDAAPRGINTWIGPRWVAIRDDMAVIGVQTVPGIEHGMVAIFRREQQSTNWERFATLGPSGDAPASNRYGMSISFDGSNLVIGAPEYDYSQIGQPPTNGAGAVYFIDLRGPDCNDNSVCDDLDIANGTSPDLNANGIPDECEGIPGDATGDRQVDVDDLLAVISAWGPCPIPPVPCSADVAPPGDGDGVVNVDDLLQVVLHWTG